MKVYIITHKKFDQKYIKGQDFYKPLLVGASCGNVGEKDYLRDNVGDNISSKNPKYCELTGIYWIWKNSTEDIVGINHYRRYFVKKHNNLLTKSDILKALSYNDIILPKRDPSIYDGETAEKFFGECHDPVVWTLIKSTIEKLYPTYVKDFEWLSKESTGYCYNMFIGHSELINQYNEWLFSILGDLEPKINFKKYNSYNQRMMGFIAERLINVWVHHNNLKVKEYPVLFTEKRNLFQKIKNKVHNVFKNS